MIRFVDNLGNIAINVCIRLGRMGLFLQQTLATGLTTKLKLKKVFAQMRHIGVNSLTVIILTGASSGGVLAYQAYKGLSRFNQEHFIGPLVFISMVREFGPVLAGIMVTSRAGSAMTAEIGTMKITEQLDALRTLCVNVHQYLTIPRLLATTIILPYLSLFCSMCGIAAGYIVAVYLLGINSELYMKSIKENAELFDVTSGLIKSAVFGFLLSWIAAYKGFTTTGGARGVGISTTQSVVFSCVAIFLADYVLTALMFKIH